MSWACAAGEGEWGRWRCRNGIGLGLREMEEHTLSTDPDFVTRLDRWCFAPPPASGVLVAAGARRVVDADGPVHGPRGDLRWRVDRRWGVRVGAVVGPHRAGVAGFVATLLMTGHRVIAPVLTDNRVTHPRFPRVLGKSSPPGR